MDDSDVPTHQRLEELALTPLVTTAKQRIYDIEY